MSVGQEVQVVFAMPERLTGKPAMRSRYTSRVVQLHVEGFPRGKSGVGVHFLYYEVERPEAERGTPQPESLSDRRGLDRGGLSKGNFFAQPHLQQFDFD
jgi:hypothetical protein